MTLSVIGGNCEAVTGSCTEICFLNRTMLFEFGMLQEGKTPKENYDLNRQMLQKVKPKAIDTIFIGHVHADHIGNIPALYATGKCKARIIVPEGSTDLLKEMWKDSAFINERECENLNRKGDKNYLPIYTMEDVDIALQYVEEYSSKIIHCIDDNVSIRYTPAGHILCSQQMELFVNFNNKTKKVLFTSDLGNTIIEDEKFYLDKFEPVTSANIVIGECTYCERKRGVVKKDLAKDLEKIESVINQFCVDGNGRVLIPTFSLDRMPYIIWTLYKIFGNDDNFNVPILVDSPLANRLLERYGNILQGERKEQYKKMLEWKNLHFIINPEDSKAAVADNRPKVILSSSGMLTAGRSVKWTQSLLPREKDCLLFIGYAGTNTLAHKIKNYKEDAKIEISGVPVSNRCYIVDLHSFSSHMQRKDLIDYYKSINCEKIYLVHGDRQYKQDFKEDLQEAVSDCLKTTKIVAVDKSTVIKI